MNLLRSLLSAVVWNSGYEADPSGGDSPSFGDDEIRNLKEAVRERLEKEHKMNLASGTVSSDGWHKRGSGIPYFQTSEPTTRPDGVTALNSDDNGRRWVRSTDYREHVYVHPNWIIVAVLEGASNLFSGDNTFSGDNVVTGTFDFQGDVDVGGIDITGDATVEGDNEFTGNNTFSGDTTFDGTITDKNGEEVLALRVKHAESGTGNPESGISYDFGVTIKGVAFVCLYDPSNPEQANGHIGKVSFSGSTLTVYGKALVTSGFDATDYFLKWIDDNSMRFSATVFY